jgi:hypothetical protein
MSDRLSTLTDHDWDQIIPAANGCVSGTSDEWPHLRKAIEKITGKPFGVRRHSLWLQGFCEGIVACRNASEPAGWVVEKVTYFSPQGKQSHFRTKETE